MFVQKEISKFCNPLYNGPEAVRVKNVEQKKFQIFFSL